jgi:glutamate synthase domain-containing protein 1
MCGIVGVFYKDTEAGAIGEAVVRMCRALFRRGPDSVGFALYGPPRGAGFVVRVHLTGQDPEARAPEVVEIARSFTSVEGWELRGASLRLEVADDADGKLADLLEERVPDALVFSVGRSMEIVKDLGSADDVDRRYGIRGSRGTHAIGHTRMATESRVDIAHSHPFWARPFPDIAVVHNGTITNYHQLRRRLELRGHRFATENDSEVIAVYLAERLGRGESLDDALRASVKDLDGTFAYLVSTEGGVGLARDQFATKPLLWAEDEEVVVLASEEVALRAAFPNRDLVPAELQAKEVRWWLR